MRNLSVSAAIDAKVAERAMLGHPFYQAWTEGRLPLDTLRAYARQYFHHVEAFPRAVSAVHSACPDRDGRRMLAPRDWAPFTPMTRNSPASPRPRSRG